MLRAVGTLCFAALLNMARGEMFDVIEAHKLPPVECTHGCARWSNLSDDGSDINQTAVDLLWRSAAAQAVANRSCAQPGRSPFSDSGTTGGYAGVSIPQLDRILLPARVSTVWFPLRDGKMHTHAQPLHAHCMSCSSGCRNRTRTHNHCTLPMLVRTQKSPKHTTSLHTVHACPDAEIAHAHKTAAHCPCLQPCTTTCKNCTHARTHTRLFCTHARRICTPLRIMGTCSARLHALPNPRGHDLTAHRVTACLALTPRPVT
jgi:hypothetical protein